VTGTQQEPVHIKFIENPVQGNSEIGSYKTGGRLMQVYFIWNALWREI